MSILKDVSNVTSKGQVTIPIAIRRHLGIGDHDKVEFVVDLSGDVRIRKVRFPTIDSIVSAASPERTGFSKAEMIEAVREDRAEHYSEKFLSRE
ncbi:MAG: AbrB/MazE/SpoVT family DNA-binding domain-containing protein [Chloroflexota bacterium]